MNTIAVQALRLLAPVLGFVLVAARAPAADSPAQAPKPDFAALDALLAGGDYAGAITAADAIAAAVRPKPRADDFLARNIELIRALMRRGVAELRIGRIDTAEATFTEAHRIFKDREFQRLVVLNTRQAGPRLPPAVVDLELAWLDLLFMRIAVVVEKLKHEADEWATAEDGSPDREKEARERIGRCLDQLKGLRKAAVDARQSFGERFNEASKAVPLTPYALSLAGPFRESLLDGLVALEQSRLPVSVLPSAAGDPASDSRQDSAAPAGADDGSRLRAKAIENLDRASAAFDGVVVAVTPKAGGLRPEMQADLDLLQAELLTARARARIESGEPATVRKDLERVLELHRQVGVLRKRPVPDSHPDLVEPLLLAAGVGIGESRRLLAEGRPDAAKEEAEEAQRRLESAASLIKDADHPLGGRLTALRQRLAFNLESIGESIPRSDAVDAAARRMIRALDAAPIVSGSGRMRAAATP